MKSKTLKEIYEELKIKEIVKIPTLHSKLDECLNGGIPFGQITQIIGFPGIGKSQLCMQIACSLQLLNKNKEEDFECIYFDSNNHYSLSRSKEIAETISSNSLNNQLSVDDILKHIHIHKPPDLVTLLSDLISIEKESKNIKLIIIDSLPSFYKLTDYPDSIKLQTLATLIQYLSNFSFRMNCCCIIVNHLTIKNINTNYTSIDFNLNSSCQSYFTKSCGISFSSFIKLSLFMFQTIDKTQLLIQSSYQLEHCIVNYEITENGIIDTDYK